MAQAAGNSGGRFPLKLLMDGKAKKVIFAEAGKGLVDFLFSMMLLPLGTVVSLLGSKSLPGTVGNLYESIKKFDCSYVFWGGSATSPEDVKAELINPPPNCSRLGEGAPLLPRKSSRASQLYKCSDSAVYVSAESYGIPCRCGNGRMTQKLTLLETGELNNERGKGFVKASVTYAITDDLLIAPLSTICCHLLMKDLKVNDLSDLQERLVMVWPEQYGGRIEGEKRMTEDISAIKDCCEADRPSMFFFKNQTWVKI